MVFVLIQEIKVYIEYGGVEMEKPKVEIKDKLNLTIEEAAAYSNIGINKIRELADRPKCSFVIHVGKKRLIKRKEFEKFIENQIEI